MEKAEKLITYMKLADNSETIQLKQIRHRQRLVKAFSIKEGETVLEIGCGQGDTTVVLADAVGPEGFIDAVDIADGNYGAPLTLKEATDYILQSNIGSRINFQFETNITKQAANKFYDIAVLSHSLFYFSSEQELLLLFKKLREISNRIAIADWDLSFRSENQIAHTQAILLQAMFAQCNHTTNNIQTLITKENIHHLLIQAGWSISHQSIVDAKELDDSKWEVAIAKQLNPAENNPLFEAYQQAMIQTEQLLHVESLDSFVIVGF